MSSRLRNIKIFLGTQFRLMMKKQNQSINTITTCSCRNKFNLKSLITLFEAFRQFGIRRVLIQQILAFGRSSSYSRKNRMVKPKASTPSFAMIGSTMIAVAVAECGKGKKAGETSKDTKIKEKDEAIAIKDTELAKHMDDLNFTHQVIEATVVCGNCKNRVPIDKKIPKIQNCECPEFASQKRKAEDFHGWIPFLETEELLIWRKQSKNGAGHFIYKVYGRYDDISAQDFMQTQLDLQYRRKWDTTAVKLEIIESNVSRNLDFIHWEMKWPKFFSNRDYSFARRYLINQEEGQIIIINKSFEHPKIPEVSGVVRITEYWSHMHIKAITKLDEPGVEFSLTYYDNPGISLPTWLQNWVAMSAMPEFLNRVRNAARAKRSEKQKI